MAQALVAFHDRSTSEDVSALESFLSSHPDSPHRVSLLLNLGSVYRRNGQLSKAFATWQEAWSLSKNETSPQARAVADQAVGELSLFLVTLGRTDPLSNLLAEVATRPIRGAAAEKISRAHEALWQMQNRPETSFKCGPFSLFRMRTHLKLPQAAHPLIAAEKSTGNGTTLAQMLDLAKRMGMDYQMAKRQPGATVPTPAMMQWKLGHFSAIVSVEDGRYLVEDTTFAEQVRLTPETIDSEASGYFLVPGGTLPPGWQAVSATEGRQVWGRMTPESRDLNALTHYDVMAKECPPNHGMAGYNVHAMEVSLNLSDVPVGYAPPRGPAVQFALTYNQRDMSQPYSFNCGNVGNQWTFDWFAYIVDDPTQTNNDATLQVRGGGAEIFANNHDGTFAVQPQSQTQLIRTSTNSYKLVYPDGSADIFTNADSASPRHVFMTQTMDPASNAVSFVYDFHFRIMAAVDAIGQATTNTYGSTNPAVPAFFQITRVTDPFQRHADFQYNTNGQLASITDIIGITSSFTYGSGDFIKALTTPYGTTTFTNSEDGIDRAIQITDPLGAQERVEYNDTNTAHISYPADDHFPAGMNPAYNPDSNNYLYQRNTFFWDKNTMQQYGGTDYTKAKLTHWLFTKATYFTVVSGVPESKKNPLEDRVWFNYDGQTGDPWQAGTNYLPNYVGRVLDDGTSQIYRYQRNLIGKPVQTVDPALRTNLFTYGTNNIDLLSVAQLAAGATNVLGQFTYNAQHRPLTAVDAAGNTTYFGYNTNGQLLAMTNALNETVFLNYNTNGYPVSIVAGTTTQLLSTNSFTYDGYGRVRTATDPLGYTVTTSYDAADRPTNVFYPDGTYQQVVYNALDPVLTRDRDGHWTSMAYDPLRHLTDTFDNVGRHTQFGWCGCGSLDSIIDPKGNVTAWVRDIQGRALTKIYPDTTQINYAYETNSSRLQSVTDAKNQTNLYSYFIDDNLKQVSYTNTAVATPSVFFTYDTNYNRLLTMVDGVGTNAYSYYAVANGQLGAGQLSSVSNSFVQSVVTYNYDALGRITNRAINGVAQQVTFDALGRMTMVTNVLGSFTNVYIGGTMLLATNFYPNGQKTIFSYLGTNNDERVAEIWNQNASGATLSKFDYLYDPEGQITNWTQQVDAASPTAYAYQYDAGKQLINAVLSSTGVGATVLKQYAYGYDLAGNRTSEQIDTGMSQASYNNLNQLTSKTAGSGSMEFAGSLDKQATVTVGGNPATVNHVTTNFVGYASVSSGTNVVPIVAADYNNNARTNKYQLVVTNNGVTKTITYDLNGNETNVVTATLTNSYQFDAANRLVTITSGTNQSLFTYDGLGRRVQDVEKHSGVAVNTNLYVWCGTELCEERNNKGATVTKRFFGEGEQISGVNYFFTRDHLGSVREMTDVFGAIQVRYDYDPYGRRTKIFGSLDADFGYARMYYHAASGLNLTLYRAYDSDLGRWNSRDPLAEAAGLNLYDYVGNDPVNYSDALGEAAEKIIIKIFILVKNEGPKVIDEIAHKNWESTVNEVKDTTGPLLGKANVGVDVPTTQMGETLATKLSNDELRGWEKSGGKNSPYPKHINPVGGEYDKLHITHRFLNSLALILIPHSNRVSHDPCASAWNLAAAGLWDTAKAIDPIFLTDGIERAFKVRPGDF